MFTATNAIMKRRQKKITPKMVSMILLAGAWSAIRTGRNHKNPVTTRTQLKVKKYLALLGLSQKVVTLSETKGLQS